MKESIPCRRKVLSWVIPAIIFDLLTYNIHALVEGDCKWAVYYPGRFSVMLMYGLIPLIISRKNFFAIFSVFQVWMAVSFRCLYSIDMLSIDALDDLLALFAFINLALIALLYHRVDKLTKDITLSWAFFGFGNALEEVLLQNFWNIEDVGLEWICFGISFLLIIRSYVFNKKEEQDKIKNG